MSSEQVGMAFPRPGPALKVLLILVAALGIGNAILWKYIPGGHVYFLALAYSPEAVLHGTLVPFPEVWRLVTAGFLTHPDRLGHLISMLIGLYFLSPDLEKRWGSARFVRFILTSFAVGYALTLAVALVAPASAPEAFHPDPAFGGVAALTAIAIVWAKMNANAQIRLFFILPVSGRVLYWITIGFCVLGLIYTDMNPEGVAAPFGGVVVGLLMGGSPSVLRTIYLRVKLAVLRRRAHGGSDGPPASTPQRREAARRRAEGPPLRMVQGGLEDELKKRRPPKDKRYLN